MMKPNLKRHIKLPEAPPSLSPDLIADLTSNGLKRQKSIPTDNFENDHIQGFSPVQRRIIHSLLGKNGEAFFGEDFTFTALKRKDSIPWQQSKKLDLSSSIIDAQVAIPELKPQLFYQTQKNKKLERLFDILAKIFSQEMICEEHTQLSKFEALLLKNILKRKFNVLSPNLESLVRTINEKNSKGITASSNKRKEEKIKFIYKMILKKMKRNFEEERNLPKDENDQFYAHYFSKTSASCGIPLSDFYDPSNNDKIKEKGKINHRYKSINTEFLSLVFSSKIYKEEFELLLKSPDFIVDYQKKLLKKIDKLLVRWTKVNDKKSYEELEEMVNKYFNQSIRCKLPWTNFEVVAANRYFSQVL